MDNGLPFEVVYVDESLHINVNIKRLVKGNRYIVIDIHECLEIKKTGYRILGFEDDIRGVPCWYDERHFRRISPYQNSVSRSLAEQALKDTVDSRQDMKPERKEVEV